MRIALHSQILPYLAAQLIVRREGANPGLDLECNVPLLLLLLESQGLSDLPGLRKANRLPRGCFGERHDHVHTDGLQTIQVRIVALKAYPMPDYSACRTDLEEFQFIPKAVQELVWHSVRTGGIYDLDFKQPVKPAL